MKKTATPSEDARRLAEGSDAGGLPLPCTNAAVRRAARRLGWLYDEALAPLELKATQAALLDRIERLMQGKQGPTLQELAVELDIQISAVTHALRPLVRDGLVVLRQNTSDRRIKHGVLTVRGRKRLADALVVWDETNRLVENVLGHDVAMKIRALTDAIASDDFLARYRELGSEPRVK